MFISKFKNLALAASLLSSAALMTLGSTAAMAAAPLAKTPAPGYFRLMLGTYEVTALSDGTVDLPMEKLLVEPEAKTTEALAKAFLKTPVETSVNAYLINTGSKLVLIDTGAGGLFGPTLGKLIANLKASGYQPEQIDDIFITHMHGDHVGGLATKGAINFPKATVHADQRESVYWLSAANMEKAPADKKGMYQGAMDSLNPYLAAKKVDLFKGSSELVPGVKSYSTYGHTEGHTVYVVESEGQKLLLIGDLIHVAAVQLDNPEVTIAFDTDQKEAAKMREKVFTEAAQQGALVGASHIQFPGLGHLKKSGKSYQWVPVNFTQMR
ncbi:MBL fold metallo-hydrolase [Cellvibrio zantedeschiae]|uniref:MBL fold metallo-hydrolase n=1 Tax=Cellvibrio zantedeschiae TaxID=1237077 RepID=A0ABQ3B154_9GAMM|nr:MBL fold metallo-hydrolase [Cellvibrio zantedeschiae]GGY73900.1 MBL fold metallo-hydrolase [Cellvibrio zantedeschiae]